MYLYFSVFVYLSQIQKYTIRSHIRSTWFHIFGLQGFTYLVYYASNIWSTRVHRQNLLKSPSHTHIYKATLHFAASLPLLICVNFFCSIIIASFSFATVCHPSLCSYRYFPTSSWPPLSFTTFKETRPNSLIGKKHDHRHTEACCRVLSCAAGRHTF